MAVKETWEKRIVNLLIVGGIGALLTLITGMQSKIDVVGVNVENIRAAIVKQDESISKLEIRMGGHDVRLTRIETTIGGPP